MDQARDLPLDVIQTSLPLRLHEDTRRKFRADRQSVGHSTGKCRQLVLSVCDHLRQCHRLDKIGFGQDDLVANVALVQHHHHIEIMRFRAVARINQEEHTLERGASGQVPSHQRLPVVDFFLLGIRKAVSRKIDHSNQAPQIIHVDQARGARSILGFDVGLDGRIPQQLL